MRRGWEEGLRRAPLGVLVLGTALLFLGGGFLLGGAYLALARSDSGWMAWLTALAIGPLVLYVAVHVLRRSRWAWLALWALLVLLLLSALARLLLAPGPLLTTVAEIALEGAALAYLRRPRVRAAFDRA